MHLEYHATNFALSSPRKTSKSSRAWYWCFPLQIKITMYSFTRGIKKHNQSSFRKKKDNQQQIWLARYLCNHNMPHSNNAFVTKTPQFHTNNVKEDYVVSRLHQKTLVFEFEFAKLKDCSELTAVRNILFPKVAFFTNKIHQTILSFTHFIIWICQLANLKSIARQLKFNIVYSGYSLITPINMEILMPTAWFASTVNQ